MNNKQIMLAATLALMAIGAQAGCHTDAQVIELAANISAKTPLDVLLAADQIIPFIELRDLVVQARSKLNGPAVSAINVGA